MATRRQFLQQAGLGLAATACPHWGVYAAPDADTRFLLVFLRGGADMLSAVAPLNSAFYREVRPAIAIAPGQLTALDADWGLHPALSRSLQPLVERGQFAWVPFAGTPDLSRSHFETQDSIELGLPQGGPKDYRSGFLNRLAGQLTGARAGTFTEAMPLVFQGAAPVGQASVASIAKGGVNPHQRELITSMYAGTPLAASVDSGFALREQVLKDLADEMDASARGAVSTRGFERDARRIARLMREHFKLGFVDIGGWDTHVAQGAVNGQLADRFDELGRGLAGFADEMGPAWQQTVVVVLSEFGRTFRENGNRGTDHGHGTTHLVLGGAVRASGAAGEQLPLRDDTLQDRRDLRVLNDYRDVLGGLFSRLYGLDAARLASVFPGAQARELGLV